MATSKQWQDSDRMTLTRLMDKLTAVTMDLKPLCDRERSMKRSVPVETTIVAACSLMETAIDDLREVIKNLDGMSSSARKPSAIKTGKKPVKRVAKRPATMR